MIETAQELEKFLDTEAYRLYDKDKRYTIKFGDPQNGRASLYLMNEEEIVSIINCFQWSQTDFIRFCWKFGDNSRSRSLDWMGVCRALKGTLHDITISQELKERR